LSGQAVGQVSEFQNGALTDPSARGTFIAFDVPGANSTSASSINAEGSVVGYYFEPSGAACGFLRNPGGSITTLDIPGAIQSFAQAINDFGAITGSYTDTNSNNHGFLLLRKLLGGGCRVVTFDAPNAANQGAIYPIAINNAGTVVGAYSDYAQHGFVYEVSGKFTTFDPPGSILTMPGGINDLGVVSGSYYDAAYIAHGFRRNWNGTFATFDVPGSTAGGVYAGVTPVTINLEGQIAGSYSDASNGNVLGFIRNTDGSFAKFEATPNAPCCVPTYSWAINSAGEIAGNFPTGSGGSEGFLRQANGTITPFQGPGANQGTQPLAINILGMITGYYSDANGTHGFLWSKTK
jgi:uncharacterized membrane protein